MNGRSRMWYAGTGVLGIGVIAAIIVAVNIIVGNLGIRVDMTDEKLYTLSTGTRDVLQSLKDPVTLKFYFNDSAAGVPMQIKTYAQGVRDLLDEYEKAADGNVIVQVFDPKPDSDEEEWAQKYGIQGQQLGFMGPMLYIGLAAVVGDAQAVIPVLDPRSDNLLEYNITRMITQVTAPRKPVIGVLSSLPVLGSERPPFMMPNQPEAQQPWFAFQDLKKDYEVRRLEASATDIPPDVDTLIVVHPKELAPATLFAVDQFVLRGGRLMAFLDPLCACEAESQPMMSPMGMPSRSSDLEPLLRAWGVTYDPGQVVADLESQTRLGSGRGNRSEDSPVWLSLRLDRMNREDVLTSQLEFVMLPYAGSLRADDSDNVKVTSLIASSETSAMVDAMSAQFGSEGVRRGFKSGLTRLNLALRLNGTFKTAYPDGKPAASPSDPADEKKDEPAASPGDALKESARPTTIILVADADMLYNRFCVQDVNFFGFQAFQPMNDNLAFFANAVEQLSGNIALASVRTRGKTDRSFDVVMDLQRQAEEKYLREEMRLQETLDDAQRRLNELQSKKDEKQRLFVSPQQQREIENVRGQVLKFKQELKLVRRKLREDIEQLGARVKALNIVLMPALVCVAGVGFGVYRRRRTAN